LDDGWDDWLTRIMKHDSMLNSIIFHHPRVSRLSSQGQEKACEMQAQVLSCLPCLKLVNFLRPRLDLDHVTLQTLSIRLSCRTFISDHSRHHHSRSSPDFNLSHSLTCYMLTAAQCRSKKTMSLSQGAQVERRTFQHHSTHVKVARIHLLMPSPVLLSWAC